jgi:hypothetical protein
MMSESTASFSLRDSPFPQRGAGMCVKRWTLWPTDASDYENEAPFRLTTSSPLLTHAPLRKTGALLRKAHALLRKNEARLHENRRPFSDNPATVDDDPWPVRHTVAAVGGNTATI